MPRNSTPVMLGIEFEGTAKCQEYQPGRKYVFSTEGGIASTFTYEAEPAGDGTKLTIAVDFELPQTLISKAGVNELLEDAKRREADQVAKNLKTILDK